MSTQSKLTKVFVNKNGNYVGNMAIRLREITAAKLHEAGKLNIEEEDILEPIGFYTYNVQKERGAYLGTKAPYATYYIGNETLVLHWKVRTLTSLETNEILDTFVVQDPVEIA